MTPDAIIYSAAIVGGIGVLVGAFLSVYKLFKKFDDVIGTDRDGRTLSERLGRVENQLWENGGSSLADRVNNIEMHVVKVSTEIELIKDITLGLRTISASEPAAAPQKTTRRKAS